MESVDRKRAVIIGAGPAGLTAAYFLLKETDIIPHILEETDMIGGISRTETYRGNRLDIGGHRFFSKSAVARQIWNDLMPLQGAPSKDELLIGAKREYEGSADPEREEAVMLRRRRVSRIFFLRKFFDYPISLAWRTFANMGLLRTLQAGFGYLASMVHKRRELSLEDFYINRFGRPLYRMFFEGYTEKVWGVHPSQISPDWGAQRVKGLSLWGALKDVLRRRLRKDYATDEASLIEIFSYPKRGPGQLWEEMARRVEAMGGVIHRGHRVTGIRREGDAITSVEALRVADGERLSIPGDYFLSSMPIKDLIGGMRWDVDARVLETAEQLPYRDFITVGLLVKRLRIKNETKIPTYRNIVPDDWIYIQEPDVRIGRLQIFNNWSPYMVADFEETVWLGLEYFCTEGDALWQMDPDAFIAFATEELERIGIIDRQDVLDATHIRVKKAYPAYFGAYEGFGAVRAYLDSIPNLYCVGRNGQHRYNNMDHSMLTAIEAVRAIREGRGDKAAIWDVNTEEAYHESSRA